MLRKKQYSKSYNPFFIPQNNSNSTTVKLLDNYDVFVDRTKLRVALQGARQKSPIFLLNKLIPLVFSEEELANSCGLGIHTTSTKSVTSKQSIPKLPLDSYKVAACKGMMSKSLDIWPLLSELCAQIRVMFCLA